MEYEYRNMMLHRTLFQHLKPWSEERTPPGGRVLYMYMLAVVCADDVMYAMSFIWNDFFLQPINYKLVCSNSFYGKAFFLNKFATRNICNKKSLQTTML